MRLHFRSTHSKKSPTVPLQACSDTVFSLPKAAESLGLSTERDLNNPNAPPRGYYITDYAIDTRGVRASTDRAFLPKALAIKRQASLTVCTGVIATRLELDAQAGLVTGVHLRSRGANLGLECFVRASREVIICSGAVCTPQLLMLRCVDLHSGISNAANQLIQRYRPRGSLISTRYSSEAPPSWCGQQPQRPYCHPNLHYSSHA